MNRIAILPARAGSKRIFNKNIRIFHGKPIIAYSIQSAIDSQCFDRIVVSTDNEEIARTANIYGAEIPFIRPAQLSDDKTPIISVMQHALKELKVIPNQDYACCICSTAPFIRPFDLNQAYNTLINKKVDYCFSATNYVFPIQRAIRITKDQHVEMFYPKFLYSRSQDLEPAYHDAGQFYWGKVEAFLNQKPIFSPLSIIHCIPRELAHDIDTFEDWYIAEIMFSALNL